DLSSLRASVKKMLVGGQLVDIMELICGDQYTLEKAETASRTGWTTDPVHPSRHPVAKIGLHLSEKRGTYSPVGHGGGADGGKREAAPTASRSDSRAAIIFCFCDGALLKSLDKMAASLKVKRTPITTPPYQVSSVDITPDPPIFSLVTTFKEGVRENVGNK
ncbi:MAG: hypothetical protein ACK56F_16550, partial [bacterium]